MTQHSLQFASIYTPLVMLFHAKFKIGRSAGAPEHQSTPSTVTDHIRHQAHAGTHTEDGLKTSQTHTNLQTLVVKSDV